MPKVYIIILELFIFGQETSDNGDVSVLVSEKEKGYLIGEFAKTLMKEVPQCRKQLRQLPM